MEGSWIFLPCLALQELHGPITGIVQALAFGIAIDIRSIGQNLHRTIEEVVQATVQLILQFLGRQDVRKDDVLGVQVFLVGWHILDIVSGTANGHLVNHLRPNLLIQVVGSLGKLSISYALIVCLSFTHQFVVFLYPRRESHRQVLNALDGRITCVLEEQEKIQVHRGKWQIHQCLGGLSACLGEELDGNLQALRYQALRPVCEQWQLEQDYRRRGQLP